MYEFGLGCSFFGLFGAPGRVCIALVEDLVLTSKCLNLLFSCLRFHYTISLLFFYTVTNFRNHGPFILILPSLLYLSLILNTTPCLSLMLFCLTIVLSGEMTVFERCSFLFYKLLIFPYLSGSFLVYIISGCLSLPPPTNFENHNEITQWEKYQVPDADIRTSSGF